MNGSLTVFARRGFQNEGLLRDWQRSSGTFGIFRLDRTAATSALWPTADLTVRDPDVHFKGEVWFPR
jgi:hypothetical protein